MMSSARAVCRRPFTLVPALVLALTGCGGDDSQGAGTGTVSPTPTPTPTATATAPVLSDLDISYQLRIENGATGQPLAVEGNSQVAGTALVTAPDDASSGQRWHAIPMDDGAYNIENMLTHQVMGIAAASVQSGAQALQWADNGTPDHLWSVYEQADGSFLIQNVNSGLYLAAASDGSITQATRDSTGEAQSWSISVTAAPAYPAPMSLTGTGLDVHDPDMIRDASGTYWLYGTHNTLAKSTNMVSFVQITTGIISPDFDWWASKNTTDTGGDTDIWAPSILHANGIYYLYYSIPIYQTPSQAGTNEGAQAVIALATSPYPDGPWTDAGQIIESCGDTAGCTTGFNAIDPAPYIDDAGNWWLAFGSWEDGIHVLQLDPATGLRLSSNTTLHDIARRDAGEEGPYVFKHAIAGTTYYYYFAPVNVCCQGIDSRYRIIVGRSTSPTGPFLDRGGIDLMEGGGTILLSSHDAIRGPGGQSVIQGPSGPLLVYHYYDSTRNGAPRLGLNNLAFDSQGWPTIE